MPRVPPGRRLCQSRSVTGKGRPPKERPTPPPGQTENIRLTVAQAESYGLMESKRGDALFLDTTIPADASRIGLFFLQKG